MEKMMNIKRLIKEDWIPWKILRLEALQDTPEAFGSSFEEEKNWSDDQFIKIINDNVIFGIFIENKLIGTAGIYSGMLSRIQHKAYLWGMYIQPTYRARGYADALLNAVINYIKDHAEQLHLTVGTTNKPGINLYQKFGFQIYGTEPHAMKISDKYYDEHLMFLKLSFVE